ncbi:GntR family transcriptional regulator [Nocardia sp. IBHARD005]|uniref:GntR family transcriptional regulator n=1 Tax=Nocardia sp. IBHARD005 TaxID=3457765 RepID=UPI004058F446
MPATAAIRRADRRQHSRQHLADIPLARARSDAVSADRGRRGSGEGRIRRQGRGTVISRPKLTQPLSLHSYTEGAISLGRTPGRILVAWEDVAADAATATDLEVELGTEVMHLERVLLADGERVGLESTYLPLHRFAALRGSYDPTTSLYAAIRATGVELAGARERIETVLAAPREAGLLECTTALPMLLLHRRSVDADGAPVERVRSLYRGDRIAVEARLSPEPA